MKPPRRIGFFAALGPAVLLLSAVILSGQTYETFQSEQTRILERAKWRIGPFRLMPSIQLKDIGYDDNVFYGAEEEELTGDYTATISPSLGVYLLYRDWMIFSLVENPEYVHYFKQSGERAWNNNFSPEVRIRLMGRMVLSGSFSAQRNRSRASSEFVIRADERSRAYGIGLFYESPRQTSMGINWRFTRLSFEDIRMPDQSVPLSIALNHSENRLSLEFDYRIFSESFLFFNAGTTSYKFDFVETRWRNSTSYQAYGGLRFPLFGRVRGTLALGYKKLAPDSGARKEYSGLVGNSNLEYRLGRLNLRASYRRDSQFSFYQDSVYYIENLSGAGVSYYLTTFIRLDYDFTHGVNKYPETIVLRDPEGNLVSLSRRDRYDVHTVRAVVRIVRNTGIGVQFNSWQRASNYLFQDRRRWFLGGFLTYEF